MKHSYPGASLVKAAFLWHKKSWSDGEKKQTKNKQTNKPKTCKIKERIALTTNKPEWRCSDLSFLLMGFLFFLLVWLGFSWFLGLLTNTARALADRQTDRWLLIASDSSECSHRHDYRWHTRRHAHTHTHTRAAVWMIWIFIRMHAVNNLSPWEL